MKSRNLMLVDDDKNFLRVLTYHIRDLGFRAIPASSGEEALKLLEDARPDLVITDLRMPGMDGMELLEKIRRIYTDLPVIVLTAHGSIDKAVEAIKRGAYDFLSKPFEKEEIGHTIANALRMASLVEENRRLSQVVSSRFEFGGIVGSSKQFKEVLGLAEQLAQVDTTVLIQGESGTGKEILAKAIHFNSRRKKKPFMVVNCGAIPKDLMESELFGYSKGSFSGAVADRKGKFEVADTGTLFLDEVAELDPNMQVKLLRVLQEKEIDVLGDPHPRPVDIRILAATHRDLRQRMKAGTFREDLFYRLSVAPLFLPPLRHRREDIPLLAHSFLDRFNGKFSKEVTLEPAALDALQAYSWPGNVRELENIVERLVVFDKNGRVSTQDLPAEFGPSGGAPEASLVQLPEQGISFEEVERDILLAALQRHDWNQTRAARYLKMTRNTLIYRMNKYGIRENRRKEELPP
jgi:two-component system NtrC family response regulator